MSDDNLSNKPRTKTVRNWDSDPYTGSLDFRLIGASVRMVRLEEVARCMSIGVAGLRKALEHAQIPIVRFGPDETINLYWLERVVFAASSPGRKGWVFGEHVPDLALLWSPENISEMALAGSVYAGSDREGLRARLKEVATTLRRAVRRNRS